MKRIPVATPGRVVSLLVVPIALFVVAIFLSRSMKNAAGSLSTLNKADLPLFVAAVLLTVVAALLYGLIWGSILTSLARSQRSPFQTLRIFGYTWLARYVPGTVPYHATRVLMAAQLGATKQVVAASVAYEALLSLGAAAAAGTAGVLVGLGSRVDRGPVYLLAAVPLAALPILLQPRVLAPLARPALARLRRPAFPRDALLSSRQTLLAFVEYGAVHMLTGLSFYFVVLAVAPGYSVHPALAIGSYVLAGAVGVVVIFVPSGLGVREAVIVGLLGIVMPVPAALVAAATARALTLIADLGLVALVALADAGRLGRSRVAAGGDPAVNRVRVGETLEP